MSAPDLTEKAVRRLVADAVTAPSMHNAQPWKFAFHAGSGVITLHGDPERAMAHADPQHRALHLGCAAALFNLRVSAAQQGRGVRVLLLPDAADPWLLAAAEIDEADAGAAELAPLYPALLRRHSNRSPFSDEPVPAELLDGLCAAARWEGGRLAVPGSWHVETLLDLMGDAERREEMSPEVRAETAAWTSGRRGTAEARDDGVPVTAFGPRNAGGALAVRDFGRSRPVTQRSRAVFESRPQLALLGTGDDARDDWLRAGQALERVLLQATSDGLCTSMTSQPLEWPELRWAVRDPVSAMGYVHMVIRLGYGPEGGGAPRRPVSEVLEFR